MKNLILLILFLYSELTYTQLSFGDINWDKETAGVSVDVKNEGSQPITLIFRPILIQSTIVDIRYYSIDNKEIYHDYWWFADRSTTFQPFESKKYSYTLKYTTQTIACIVFTFYIHSIQNDKLICNSFEQKIVIYENLKK